MPQSKRFHNPFYVLLVAAGILFTVTACAYFVMMLRSGAAGGIPETGTLMAWLENYGMTALIVELVALSAATLAAMGTDDYWERRARRDGDKPADHPPDNPQPSEKHD